MHFRIVRFNLFWKCSPFIVLFLLLVGLFIPMGWGAPSGTTLVIRNSVPIIAGVAGKVTAVPVTANAPLKAGDVLFKIDAVKYQATLDQYTAQLARDRETLAKDQANLTRYHTLEVQNSIARQQAEDQQAAVRQDEAVLKLDQALIDGAQHDLDNTVVTAPTDGYVTNLSLREGARVAASPVMAFIDTSETIVGVEIQQIDARYLATGQPAEIAFKFFPGRILTGTVVAVLQAVSTGQTQASGSAATPQKVNALPFAVRVKLDDSELAKSLPAGSTGTAAIYTDRVKPAQIIRKVLLRQVAIVNYVNPF